jgi:hypothetical protein
MRFVYETDDEKAKLPWVALAVVAALAIAGCITFPHEIMSFLKEGKELVAGKEGLGKPGHDSKNSMCNGFIVVNCNAEPKVVQNTPADREAQAPVVVENKTVTPQMSAPVMAQIKDDHPLSQSSRQTSKLRKPEPKNALARADAPLYRSIGPNDDLTLLGIDRFKPAINLCALKMYLPCYMPPGFGRDIVVREVQD